MISKKAVALCATLGVVLSGIALAAPASADPVSNSYAIVGSDTLEDVVSALANGTNITGPSVRTLSASGATIGSFDATGSPYITTKSGGTRFGRPNGSGDGVKALSRSLDGAAYTSGTAGSPANVVISGQVDIARSSSGPGSAANASGELVYIPFGRDAIAYIYKGNAALASVTPAQLKAAYECTSDGTINGVTTTVVIPQAGSGTRKDFLSKIGSDEAGLKTVSESGCVIEGQEHDGTSLNSLTNAIMPMAASRWIAMNTGASYDKRGTATVLGSLVTSGGNPVAAVTGTGTSMAPNSAYYADSTWGRDTYLVVEYARLATDPGLAALVDPSLPTSLTNSNSALSSRSGAVKLKYGFLPPSTTTQTRANKTP